MMKRLRLNRPFCVTMLAITGLLFLSYFPLARIRAANAGATILRSASPANPLVNLKNAHNLKVTYTGPADAVTALQTGTANPTALAAADFDADGAMDLVAGYSTNNGGVLVLMRGNPDAYAPKDTTLYQKAMQGNVPPTFLSKASAFALPESPDFLATGDFNRDGYKDVLVAARGGSLYLLAGDGTGNFAAPQPVALADQVVAMAATPDGHVAVSTDGSSGPQIAILAPNGAGLAASRTFALPSRGVSVEWGSLGGGADLAVGAGPNVVMIYGALSANPQTETVSLPFNVQAIALGDFIWDRDARTEIAVLADDGTIHILQHGTLNTAPLKAADIPGRRAAMMKLARSHQPPNPTALGAWTVARQLPYSGSAPAGPVSTYAFSSPHLAASPTHDLMVLDAGRSQLNILDTSGTTASPSAGVAFSSTPVAALALPQKIDAGRDLVVLTAGQVPPMLLPDGVGHSYTVTTTADGDDVGACATNSSVTSGTGPDGTLSLREAVCEANNSTPAPSTISVPSGTYSLSVSTFGGKNSASSSVALQVGIQSGDNITISGAGAASTIIRQTDGIDRVMEGDELLNGNMPLAVQNVTLTGGNCTTGLDCISADSGGAAILAGYTGDPLTITNVVMSGNQANPGTMTNELSGGALYFSGPNLTIGNSTFSNNTASGDGGAIVFLNGFFNGGYLSGNVSITNSTFTGNTAQVAGGAISFANLYGGNSATISGSTFTGNQVTNSAGAGGAIIAQTEVTSNGDASVAVSNSRITGNTAPAGGTGVYAVFTNDTLINNWWGCNGGPGASGCDTVLVDSNGGSASFNPWLVLGISANPASIGGIGSTSKLTADLTHNSNGTGGNSVPNGTPVAFGATSGSDNPTSTTLTSGQATSIFTATGTCSGSGTATVDNQTVSATIQIGTAPTISNPNNTTFTVGTSGSFTVTTTGSPAPSLSESGGLPSGVSFHDNGNGTGTLSGTPNPGTGGVYHISFTASSCISPNGSQSFTLTVNEPPAFTSANSTNFTQGASGSFTVTTTGSPAAALSESGTLPTGVSFHDNGNGTGTLGGTPTQAGSFSITFTANNGVAPNATQSFTLTVPKLSTSTSLVVDDAATASPWAGTEVTGASAYASSTVTPGSGGGPVVTGTVTYSLFGDSICFGTALGVSVETLASGIVPNSDTFGPLSAGLYSFNAKYSGDSNYNSSGSSCVSFTVSKAPTSISVTNVNPSSEAYGQDGLVTITAVLSWAGGGPAPTGSVTIGGTAPSDTYGTTICGAPSGNTITCSNTYNTTVADVVGTYTFSAGFSGDTNYNGSSSAQSNNFSITQATTTTSVASSQNPSLVGQSVTFTATIDGQYGLIVQRNGTLPVGLTKSGLIKTGGIQKGLTKKGVTQIAPAHPPSLIGIGGNVAWSANTGCGTTPVSGNPGTSQCTTTVLPQGTDTITATYLGDNNHSGSTGTLNGGQVVNPSSTPTSIAVTNVSPASEAYGQDAQVTITAVLSWTGSGPAPTASDVTISGNAPSGTYGVTSCGAPSGDTITCMNTYTPTAADVVGTYTFSANFSGDSNYGASSSTQTNNFSITQATSTTAVTSGQNPSVVGQPVTFTATIDGQYGPILQRGGASSGGGSVKRGLTQRGLTGKVGQAHPSGPAGPTVTWSANTGCAPSSVGSLPTQVMCTTSVLPQGTDTITATYSGDTNHSGSSGTLNGGQVVNPATVNVTVGTSPAGLAFSVDGTPYSSAQNFTWNIGDMHTIATTSPQFPSPGTEDTFTSWSDSGAISHMVTASAGTTSYTASFNTTYQLTTAANPISGGTVTPSSGAYYAPNAVVSLTATANPNYAFSNWTGNVANPNSASTTVTMTGPQSVTANFVTGQVVVSPTSLNFGNVKLGRVGKKVVTVTNTGSTKVQIGPITLSVTMGDPSQFTVDHACTAQLRPGRSCVIGVRFVPDAVGPDAATLNIVTSAPGSPIEVPITAAGIPKH